MESRNFRLQVPPQSPSLGTQPPCLEGLRPLHLALCTFALARKLVRGWRCGGGLASRPMASRLGGRKGNRDCRFQEAGTGLAFCGFKGVSGPFGDGLGCFRSHFLQARRCAEPKSLPLSALTVTGARISMAPACGSHCWGPSAAPSAVMCIAMV